MAWGTPTAFFDRAMPRTPCNLEIGQVFSVMSLYNEAEGIKTRFG